MNELPAIVLSLPCPPSLNKLWSTAPGKKRVRSPAYSLWLREAGWIARMQLVGVPEITGIFSAEITVPVSSTRDRDGWTKSIFDLLQHARAVRNDSGLRAYSVVGGQRDDVLVTLWDLGGPEQREPKPMRMAARHYRARPTHAQVRRARSAGVLV